MKRVKLKNHRFYVYEYWRPDIDLCFYVGKGCGWRVHSRQRNRSCKKIIRKLAKKGLVHEVRLVKGGITENEAFDLEIQRIAFWRESGVKLTNRTYGGEGVSGRIVSEETRKKIGAGNKGKVHSEEQNKNHSKTMRGRKLSADHCAKISVGLQGHSTPVRVRVKLRLSNRGQKRSEQTKLKLHFSHIGKIHKSKTKEKMREAHQRRWANMTGEERLQHSLSVKKGQENYNRIRCRRKRELL